MNGSLLNLAFRMTICDNCPKPGVWLMADMRLFCTNRGMIF